MLSSPAFRQGRSTRRRGRTGRRRSPRQGRQGRTARQGRQGRRRSPRQGRGRVGGFMELPDTHMINHWGGGYQD